MSYSASQALAPEFDACERALRPRQELAADTTAEDATRWACPACGGALLRIKAEPNQESAEQDGLRCEGCAQRYPEIVFDDFRVPWLFADPNATAAGWWQRLNAVRAETRDHRSRAFDALRDATISATTRRRIRGELRGRRAQLEEIEALLQPLNAMDAWREANDASQDSALVLPNRQGLLSYANSVLRDWCWGEEAPTAALDAVVRVLEPTDYGPRTLVMGAGAGRLGLDLHAAADPQQPRETTLLDFNPLLLAVAARMARGGLLRMHEMPLAPLGIDQIAVERRSRALPDLQVGADQRGTSSGGLRFVVADALRPPFAPGSFSTVVTPWLMDILEQPLALPGVINRLLEAGGHWIFTGSCVFDGRDPREQLCQDELLELAQATGFAIEKVQRRLIPYACSGASAHRRQESVLTFHARKREDAEPSVESRPADDHGDDLAIEGTAVLEGACARHLLAAQVLGAVDGERTIRDIAELVARRYQLPPANALLAVRDVLQTARNG
ncbi:MAG: hypothetical protein AAF515_06610 [Pseudomonadota bacterium]